MSLRVALRHAFDGFGLDVAFTAGPGVTALFGRSGAGKTTVVNAVAGLLRPDHADIALGQTLFDSGTTHLPPNKRRIGYVFQDARLFPHLSVAENLDYAARFGARAKNRDQIVALLGLGDLLGRRPATLSGGQKQRVALGRALLSAPQLLLMDEPLAALDAPRKAEILPYLERLKAESAVPILYVSHALDEVARLADRIVVLDGGRIRADGPVFDVLADPELVPLFGVREAGAILPATVTERAADGLTRLTTSAGDVHLMGVHAAQGDTIRLRVLAQDVMLSRTRPDGLSALNILPVRISHIYKGDGPGVALRLMAGDDPLLARITARALAYLDLSEGDECFAILKASSVAPTAISGAQTAPV
ncbi:molybdenum ABC transporter ATP-binding protein [uncultured Tateyamaria sp.]|uniref:molybdenum ABC transporter ATP-binding protein n=1 Tax=Tateyamaria sp. 1078 TaxID=3417464 RepID=UPI0026296D4B|nr:molybdenum ABC transporter ATP-binding protein [uncultured Tateyamaria sp.]